MSKQRPKNHNMHIVGQVPKHQLTTAKILTLFSARKCDLASLESVREFVAQFKSEQEKCDVLVNNAGVMNCRKMLTKVRLAGNTLHEAEFKSCFEDFRMV